MKTTKLTIKDQINHLLSKGILFDICSELEAEIYLRENCYFFRIKAYAKSFETYTGGPNQGKYCKCDFSALRELSILDMRLREVIMAMAVDIEHFLKTKLLYDISRNPYEDGTTIIYEVFSREEIDEIERQKIKNGVCHDLVEKFQGRWTVWSLVEVLSFSETLRLYSYYFSKNPEYGDRVKNDLESVRFLRNAAAHNNCLLNSLRRSYSTKGKNFSRSIYDSICLSGIIQTEQKETDDEHRLTTSKIKKWMENRVVNDFITMIVVYNRCVTSEGVRTHRMQQLQELFSHRMLEHKELFKSQRSIVAAYNVVRKIIDFSVNTSI